MSQLLVETNLFEYKKEVSESGKLILSGVIQRADSKNYNGRIYPRDILEKEIRNYQILVNERRALGQLDHTDQSLVELKDVSHLITELRWEGNDVVGRLEILDTPNGKIVKSLIESGVKLGVSSRAVGSIKEQNGASYVQSDLQMICWDIVSDPSTKGAFLFKESISPEKIMLINEGKTEQLFNKEYRVNRILNKFICGCEDHCKI